MNEFPRQTPSRHHAALYLDRAGAVGLLRPQPDVVLTGAIDLRLKTVVERDGHDGEYASEVYQKVYRGRDEVLHHLVYRPDPGCVAVTCGDRSAPPGIRTRNLRIKSPLLCR